MLTLGKLLSKGHKGWLMAKIEGKDTLLHYGLRLKILDANKSYQKILILEGRYEGLVAEIPYFIKDKTGYVSYIDELKDKYKPLTLKYDFKRSVIIIDRLGEFSAILFGGFKPGETTYLELPDFPHTDKLPKEYTDESIGGSRFAETWFRIISSNKILVDSYLHFGRVSKGCLTIEYERRLNNMNIWSDIYFHLMSHRIDNKYIAKLIFK